MEKKYKIRKMSFICENNRIISPNVHMTNAYQYRDIAESVCKQNQPSGNYMWQKNQPIPKVTVEDFYLLHASIYSQLKPILTLFFEEVPPPKR